MDTQSPVFNADPEDYTAECDGAGNFAELSAWLASHGNAQANDVCSGVNWSDDFATGPGLSDGFCATGSVTVTFYAKDDCGNTASRTATFTISDTQAPDISPDPQNYVAECDGSGNSAELSAWLASHGNAGPGTDACSGVTWTNNFVALTDDCGATGSATVTFTATDDCGNATSEFATFTIVDTQAPTFTRPANITIYTNATCGYNCSPSNTGDVTNENDACSTGLNATYTDVVTNGPCQGAKVITRT